MTRTEFEESLARDGFKMRESVQPANKLYPDHAHDIDLRLYILTGEISATYDGQTLTCKAGDSFSMAAGVHHVEQIGPEGATYLVGEKVAQPA